MLTTSETTLDSLASQRRWVAWRNELRGDVPTKVPYSTPTRHAKSNDPSTWITRAEAERLAERIKNGQAGGTGIVLGQHADATTGGVDLDKCRDPATGAIEPWAREVIERLGTYSEVSPSGTGVKSFFQYDPGGLATLSIEMGGTTGRKWSRGKGAHPAAIELHLTNRYYTVTG
jgi:putative DNA primase/helicase